jgi:hypothetical protein
MPFDAVVPRLNAAGIRVVLTPYRAPDANAYAERFVRSIKDECLGRVILFVKLITAGRLGSGSHLCQHPTPAALSQSRPRMLSTDLQPSSRDQAC